MLQYTVSYTTIAAYATRYGLIHNHRCIRYNVRSHTQPSLHMLQCTVSYTTIAAHSTMYGLIHNHRCIRYNVQVPKTNSFSPSSLQRTQPNTPHIEQAVGLACWTEVLDWLWDWRLGLTCWTEVLDWLWDWRVDLAVGLACWIGCGTDILD